MAKDNKNIVITSRLTEKCNEELEKIASEKRRKKADLIRIILEDYVKLMSTNI